MVGPEGVSLRPVRGDDEPALRALFATGDAARDVARVPEPLRSHLLAQQYVAWIQHLRGYEGLDDAVVLLNGRFVGRRVVSWGACRVHVVDLTIDEGHRHRGIGTQILRALVHQAEGRPVGLMARRGSPALRLYQRQGFRIVEEGPAFVRCEWSARAAREDGQRSTR